MNWPAKFLVLALAAVCPATIRAGVRLPALFSNGMVLQQGSAARVWGWADDGEQVKITFRGHEWATVARNGKWMVALDNLAPGGPDTLTVSGKNSVVVEDVLVGEVWLCSGQSNMGFDLQRAADAQPDIDAATNAMIRLLVVPRLKAEHPMDDIKLAWKHCTPREAGNFSAVGYYFGRDLQKARGVPVGLIQSSWGGSPIESWMDPKTIASTESAPRPWHPSELFNGMIAPLIPFGIKGAAWYQGEANVGLGRALPYHLRLSDMINSWRQDWGLGNFPFLIVQIAPFKPIKEQPAESPEAELREAQSLVAKELPAVGLVVTTDVGDPATIHPTKKRPVGQRLALEARALAYGEKITFSGPLFHSMETDGSKMILSFDGTGSGLAAGGEKLAGFAVSGSNRKFVYANAQIQGDKVVVSSPAVPHPVAVRYAWADCPVANLENREGLPAVPFRTDHFAFRKDPRKP